MPVTVRVANHDANQWSRQHPTAYSSKQVLILLNRKPPSGIGEITTTASGYQTSLGDEKLKSMNIIVNNHGLIWGALHAYNFHHHLILRPEDIWFAILTQFSFYVNAHFEELRSSFVTHDGKTGLIVEDPGQSDMSLMYRNMTKLIEEIIVDPKLREWIKPSFTTTTINDEVVASVIMMGTLQKYFDYVFETTLCGIPTVTLLGTVSDWEEIKRRIEKLTEYGEEPTIFCAQLRPILASFVATFSRATGDESITAFWSQMIDHRHRSGESSLTGWMIAFCFWDEDGRRIVGQDHRTLNLIRGVRTVPSIKFHKIPAGFISVPVVYMDPNGIPQPSKLLAGFASYEITKAVNFERKEDESDGQIMNHDVLNSIQPVTAWWMFQSDEVPAPRSDCEHYLSKLVGNWNDQASTGTVNIDGKMVVKAGLPDRIFRTLPNIPKKVKSWMRR